MERDLYFPSLSVCGGVPLGSSMEGTSPAILSPSPAPPSASAVVSPIDYSPMLQQNTSLGSSSNSPPCSTIYSQSTSSMTTLVPLQPADPPKTNSLRYYSLSQSNG